jgi:hypothetical protein
MLSRLHLTAVALLTAVAAIPIARAQIQVTNITYGTMIDGANTNNQGNNNLDFQNQYTPVSQIETGLGGYGFTGPTATSIVGRRNTTAGNANNTTVFYQTSSSGSTNPLGNYESSLQEMFLGANLTEGLRNPFGNGSSSVSSNLERIDFVMPNYTVQANDSLVFFDLENTGNFGDGFRIAAFTALGTVNGFTNAPTVYANNGLLVSPDSFGPAVNSPTGGTNGNFERVTYTNGDNFSGSVTNGNIVNIGNGLNLVGIMIRFSDLGIAAGTTIQGFSLMGADVVLTSTSGSGLVNWNNTSAYLTNTSSAGVGNMDFMAFGATVARPIPEPSTYGAIMIGAALSGWLLLRRNKKNAASKAA